MATLSKKVYLAPSSMYAFIDRGHPKHQTAGAFFRYFATYQYQLYTDSIAITRTYDEIYTKVSPSLAKDYLRVMALTDINIFYPDESEMKAALKTLVTYRTTDLTFPDALIATLANKNRIPHICTFTYLHPLFGLTTFYLPI